eukprot:15421-Heterococcus_DN1.PRE.4
MQRRQPQLIYCSYSASLATTRAHYYQQCDFLSCISTLFAHLRRRAAMMCSITTFLTCRVAKAVPKRRQR